MILIQKEVFGVVQRHFNLPPIISVNVQFSAINFTSIDNSARWIHANVICMFTNFIIMWLPSKIAKENNAFECSFIYQHHHHHRHHVKRLLGLSEIHPISILHFNNNFIIFKRHDKIQKKTTLDRSPSLSLHSTMANWLYYVPKKNWKFSLNIRIKTIEMIKLLCGNLNEIYLLDTAVKQRRKKPSNSEDEWRRRNQNDRDRKCPLATVFRAK